MNWDRRRRWFLRSAATAAVAGVAGCSGGDDDTETPVTDETTPTDSDTPTATETATQASETATPERTPHPDPQAAVDEWLSGVSNYDGRIVYRPDETTRTVSVGVERPSGDPFGYGPAAIRVEEGTTVQWQWTGNGGAHSVTERDGRFDSGTPDSASGNIFNHEFTERGVYRYQCKNHGGSFGMRGAVVVQERQTLSGYPTVDEWLDGYDFDGRLADGRGQDAVDVTVGESGNDGFFAFDPITVYVETGTDVVFDWTGRGGAHDVTWRDGEFTDSETTNSAAQTYTVTMDEPGIYRYFCDVHAPTGGRGVIVVDQ